MAPDERSDAAHPAGEQLMTVRTVERADAVVIVVEGEVDGYTAPRLQAAIDGAAGRVGDRPLVVDMVRVGFLGSPGLAALTACAQAARRDRGADALRVVVDHNRPVVRPIQIAGLDDVLALFYSVEDALVG